MNEMVLNLPYPITPTAVTHIRNTSGANNSANMPDRFWNVDKTGSNGVASLTFTYAPAENALNGNTNVRMQLWNSVQEAWEPPLVGQVNPSSQSVLVPGAAYSGVWGSALSGNPLPIELIEFNAELNKFNEVELRWTTASEINNDYFTVERSADGIYFETIAIVDGAGNSTTNLNYRSLDKYPYYGVSYYRLKQTDFNGDYSYSQIEKIEIKEDGNWQLYPNPANQSITLVALNELIGDELNQLYIIDLLGQVVKEIKYQQRSEKVIEIDLGQLAPGNYFIHLGADKPRRFVKL